MEFCVVGKEGSRLSRQSNGRRLIKEIEEKDEWSRGNIWTFCIRLDVCSTADIVRGKFESVGRGIRWENRARGQANNVEIHWLKESELEGRGHTKKSHSEAFVWDEVLAELLVLTTLQVRELPDLADEMICAAVRLLYICSYKNQFECQAWGQLCLPYTGGFWPVNYKSHT